MHEMALTESVVDILVDEGRRRGFSRVKKVWLEIGVLSGVEAEAMIFCFDVVARGTLAEGAALEIVRTPGQGWCLACEKDVALAERFGPCPDCGGHRVQMTAGDEMRVKELEVE